jgi:curved DNA-binding protein CbpA
MILRDYYAFLELQPDASAEDIKRSYRRLVRMHHPDASQNSGADERFHQIQEAYDVLSDAARREEYDVQHRQIYPTDERVRLYQQQQEAADTEKAAARPAAAERDAQSEADRRWKMLHSHYESRAEVENHDGASSANMQDEGEPKAHDRSPPHSLFGKLKQTVAGSLRRGGSAASPEPRRNRRSGPIERERFYQFTLSTLESLRETSREIALESGNPPRIIRVKIPAGVQEGTVLKIHCPETDAYPARHVEVRIHIEPHEYVERQGRDITVRVPVTVFEAINGSEIEVPTLDGPARIRLPHPWSPSATVKMPGGGLRTENESGDLYIKTFIVLPEILNDTAKQAGRAIEELYTGSVRRNLIFNLSKSPRS